MQKGLGRELISCASAPYVSVGYLRQGALARSDAAQGKRQADSILLPYQHQSSAFNGYGVFRKEVFSQSELNFFVLIGPFKSRFLIQII